MFMVKLNNQKSSSAIRRAIGMIHQKKVSALAKKRKITKIASKDQMKRCF
jgi:hypothetical protein